MKIHPMNKPMMNSQRGAAALLVSLVILTLITLVSLMTAETISMEQKISGNELRSRQAFEAAEAGMTAALTYLDKDAGGPDRNDDDVLDLNVFDVSEAALAATGVTGAANEYELADASGNVGGSGSVTVTMEDVSPDSDMTQVFITAVGLSADGSATRTVSLLVPTINPVPNVPDNPFTGQGTVSVTGNISVYNPEGRTTIWTADNVDMAGSGATDTFILPPPDFPCYIATPQTCKMAEATNKSQLGIDVVDNDSSLAELSVEELFYNTFAMSMTDYRATIIADIGYETDTANYGNDYTATPKGVDNSESQFVYVDASGGDITAGVDFGCAGSITGGSSGRNGEGNTCDAGAEPGVLIIDGNLEITGGDYFGLIFVTGNLELKGNAQIQGAIVVGGTFLASAGTPSVWYDSSLLNDLGQDGPKSGAAGTWRDFD